MEKLNIVWIKKWKIKRNLISVMTKIKAFFEKRNWNYVAIIAIIFGGAVVVYTSCWINDSDRRNIAVGIGTGIITSALVTLYLEIINAQIERKKLQKYKKMIFSPLCDSVRKLYIHIILNIDEYRVREEKKTLFFIPMKETKEISDFFKKMQEIDIESITEEKEKRKLEEFSTISLVYFKEIISQYEGLPFESLLLDNIITQEEYDNLKASTVADIANCGKKCGATAAARFLGEFVEKKPWVHLDIAGTSESDEDKEIYSKGGTGAATMLLYETVKLMEKPYKSH